MNVLSTQYTLTTKSFEIYLAGCNGQPKCKGCHNKGSWSFTQGETYNEEYYLRKIKTKIVEFDNMIENLMIFGGEPLDQNHSELLTMLHDLRELNKNIWLFTRYDLDEIPQEIQQCCDYIKCGRYIPELTVSDNVQYGVKLATSNQRIYKKGIDY